MCTVDFSGSNSGDFLQTFLWLTPPCFLAFKCACFETIKIIELYIRMMLPYEFHVLELGIEMNVYDPHSFFSATTS